MMCSTVPSETPASLREQRAERGVADEVEARRDDVVAVGHVHPAEADAALGRRAQHQARRPPGMEAHPDQRRSRVSRSSALSGPTSAAAARTRGLVPVAVECRDMDKLGQIKVYDRLQQRGRTVAVRRISRATPRTRKKAPGGGDRVPSRGLRVQPGGSDPPSVGLPSKEGGNVDAFALGFLVGRLGAWLGARGSGSARAAAARGCSRPTWPVILWIRLLIVSRPCRSASRGGCGDRTDHRLRLGHVLHRRLQPAQRVGRGLAGPARARRRSNFGWPKGAVRCSDAGCGTAGRLGLGEELLALDLGRDVVVGEARRRAPARPASARACGGARRRPRGARRRRGGDRLGGAARQRHRLGLRDRVDAGGDDARPASCRPSPGRGSSRP